MKIKFILILTILTQNLNAQNHLYIDEKGSEINKTELRKKLLNDSLLLSSWSYTDKEGNRITTLKKDLYLTGVFKYYDIKRQLEKVTGREVKENTTLLIEYYFKDDLCTASRDNYWSKTEILHRKNFTTPIRNNIQKKKIIYIALFEEGITLRNNTNNKNEYFFSDQGNFLGKKFS
ncbi:hypothetical protein [Yeosuana marina]|uniref:hypothetical protein n=1 Tax=Yeosuana marina TaxID=1565536 RepID=UPI0030C8075C